MNYTSELGGVMNEFPFWIENRVERKKKEERKKEKKKSTVFVLSYYLRMWKWNFIIT